MKRILLLSALLTVGFAAPAGAIGRGDAIAEFNQIARNYKAYAVQYAGFRQDAEVYHDRDYLHQLEGSGTWRSKIRLNGLAGGQFYIAGKVCDVYAAGWYACGTFHDLRRGNLGW